MVLPLRRQKRSRDNMLGRYLISWVILAFSVWASAAVLPGVHLRNREDAFVVAAIFGALNWLIGWLLFLMIGLGTLGLGFLLVFVTRLLVSAILLRLTHCFTQRLTLDSFRWALVAALMMSLVGTLLENLLLNARAL